MTIYSKTLAGLGAGLPSIARIATIAFLPFALGACKHLDGGPQVAGWSLIDPSQRHPIMVSQQPANLTINVAKGSQGLTPQQRAEVLDFAQRYRAGDAGNSRLVISAPSGSPNEIAAMAAVDEIREITIASGFGEAGVAVEAYQAEGAGHAPVRISYMRYVAEGPECGAVWIHDSTRDTKNLPSPNFGCSQQHNLAAMIANPSDLLGPRSESARYSRRRDKVFDGYVDGKSTGSERSQDERISTEGGN